MAPGSLHSSIQHAILTAADRVNLKWPGLPAATWAKLQNDAAEADRIEFLGDAVVRLVLSHEVYKRYPTEGPGLYTVRTQTPSECDVLNQRRIHRKLFKPSTPTSPFTLCSTDQKQTEVD